MSTLDFARAADDTVDYIAQNNPDGTPLFYIDGEEHFVNGKLIHYVYTTLTLMGASGQPFGALELANLSYLLAAIEARSRGTRLVEEMKDIPGVDL